MYVLKENHRHKLLPLKYKDVKRIPLDSASVFFIRVKTTIHKDIVCSVSVTVNVLNNILCLFTIDHMKGLNASN